MLLTEGMCIILLFHFLFSTPFTADHCGHKEIDEVNPLAKHKDSVASILTLNNYPFQFAKHLLDSLKGNLTTFPELT